MVLANGKKVPPSVIVLTMNAGHFAEGTWYQKWSFGGANSAGSAIEHYKDACEEETSPGITRRDTEEILFDHLTREDGSGCAGELDRLSSSISSGSTPIDVINGKEAQELPDTPDVCVRGSVRSENASLILKTGCFAGITDSK